MIDSSVRKMIYPAPSISVPSEPPVGFENVWLVTESNIKIHGWHYRANNLNAAALIYFHGNGENLQTLQMSGLIESLRVLNLSLLFIDYPGYGQSAGKPSEDSLIQAATAAVQQMKTFHPESKLIACGWSLGAAVAIEISASHPELVNGLIAMSAWSSLHDVAKKHFPGWMVRLLLQESYDNVKAARKIVCPSLLIHGQEDELIPLSQAQILTEAFSGKHTFIVLPGVSHNDLLGSQRVWTEISYFVKSLI